MMAKSVWLCAAAWMVACGSNRSEITTTTYPVGEVRVAVSSESVEDGDFVIPGLGLAAVSSALESETTQSLPEWTTFQLGVPGAVLRTTAVEWPGPEAPTAESKDIDFVWPVEGTPLHALAPGGHIGLDDYEDRGALYMSLGTLEASGFTDGAMLTWFCGGFDGSIERYGPLSGQMVFTPDWRGEDCGSSPRVEFVVSWAFEETDAIFEVSGGASDGRMPVW
ncbi:MAG: hypothetical protein KC912_22360 [Proteobacteria bacterium]|nr:hypothetical protein [Pseudomonadota bacterium]